MAHKRAAGWSQSFRDSYAGGAPYGSQNMSFLVVNNERRTSSPLHLVHLVDWQASRKPGNSRNTVAHSTNMSTGIVSLAVVSVVVLHVLLLLLLVLPVDGAVRGPTDRHSFASAASKPPIDRPGIGRSAYGAGHGHRRPGKSYACLQDLAQTVVPPGPELAGGDDGEAAMALTEDRTVVVGEDDTDADIDDDIDIGSGTNGTMAGGMPIVVRRQTDSATGPECPVARCRRLAALTLAGVNASTLMMDLPLRSPPVGITFMPGPK
uniref:Uncharacterized protein n=1 Tax=Anopheles merus TaxID=30066 RepID=A0A182VJ16_ANOME